MRHDRPLHEMYTVFIKPYGGVMLQCMLLTLGKTVIAVFIPYCFKVILDQFIPAEDFVSIYKWGIIAALSIAVSFIMDRGRIQLSGSFSNLINATVRKSIVERLQQLRYRYFQKKSYGQINTNVLQDVDSFGNAVFGRMFNSISHGLYFGLTFILLLRANLILSISVYLFIGFMVWIISRLKRMMSFYSQEFAAARSDLHVFLSDFSNNLQMIRSYAVEEQMMGRFKEKNRTFVRKWLAINIFGPAIQSSIELATLTTYLLAFLIGSRAIQNGTLTAGGLLLYLSYLPQIWSRFGNLTDLYYGLLDARVYANRIMETLSLEVEDDQHRSPNTLPNFSVQAGIEFRQVSFRYPGQTDLIYNKLSFAFLNPGLYAVVGQSGSGKSTLFELLLGFYQPDEGEIRIGGHSVQEYPLEMIRQQIGIVHQDIFLMAGTVMENIAFGDSGITRSKVEQISEFFGFHDHLSKLEGGYDAQVGIGGELLSAGQQRIISILRIICRNPHVILFDEVTSNIDSYTEQLLHGMLRKLASDKICIMITHKHADVEIADRILRVGN